MDDLVGARGHDVFFDQHFDSVGSGLEQTEWTDAIWSEPILNARENFSFEQRHHREEREKNREQRDDVEQAGNDFAEPMRCAGEEREDARFGEDEDLIEKAAHAGEQESEVSIFKQGRFAGWPAPRTQSKSRKRIQEKIWKAENQKSFSLSLFWFPGFQIPFLRFDACFPVVVLRQENA
jgi:hypothetical protein